MRERGVEPDFPECDAIYLANYLWEVGPFDQGGMGPSAVTHSEIRAWQDNVGVELTSWEARTLRALSEAYLGETIRAKSPSCQPPWSVVPIEEKRKDLPKIIKSVLRG